jgi:hypothetical protein
MTRGPGFILTMVVTFLKLYDLVANLILPVPLSLTAGKYPGTSLANGAKPKGKLPPTGDTGEAVRREGPEAAV